MSGPVGNCSQEQGSTTLMTHTLWVESLFSHDAQALDKWLQTFWNLESFGVNGTEHSVLDEFQAKVRFEGGKYMISLPWKDPHQSLPDNYQLSLRRLQCLLQCLKQVLAEYDAIIKKQIEQGIVEVVEPSDN